MDTNIKYFIKFLIDNDHYNLELPYEQKEKQLILEDDTLTYYDNFREYVVNYIKNLKSNNCDEKYFYDYIQNKNYNFTNYSNNIDNIYIKIISISAIYDDKINYNFQYISYNEYFKDNKENIKIIYNIINSRKRKCNIYGIINSLPYKTNFGYQLFIEDSHYNKNKYTIFISEDYYKKELFQLDTIILIKSYIDKNNFKSDTIIDYEFLDSSKYNKTFFNNLKKEKIAKKRYIEPDNEEGEIVKKVKTTSSIDSFYDKKIKELNKNLSTYEDKIKDKDQQIEVLKNTITTFYEDNMKKENELNYYKNKFSKLYNTFFE